MATDSEEKRKSSTDLGQPWRQPGVDPTRTGFDAASRAGAGGMYSFGDPAPTPALAIDDMVNITTKQVYTDLLDASGVTVDADVVTMVEALTVNPEVDDYDWSSFSLATYHSSTYSTSVPTTLISATHGLSANHNKPFTAGDKCWFRDAAGDAFVGTVAAATLLTNSGCYLIRFTANPSATIVRPPIINDSSLQEYVGAGGQFWQFYQDLAIKLRECTGFAYNQYSSVAGGYCDIFQHQDSDWAQGTITEGSGRPVVVPLNDGTLVLLGTVEFATGNDRVSLDIAQIQSILSGYSETITLMDLPGYSDGGAVGNLPGSTVGFGVGALPGSRLKPEVLRLLLR